MTETLKQIAWNGIHLSVPSSWEIGRIGTRHLFFENNETPAMEIKWGPVRGRFSLRSHLKKLLAQHKHQPDKNLKEWHLPPVWENALSNFDAKGFSWQSGMENGRGAVLFCHSCNNAIMFQIFNIAGHITDALTIETLKSLQDHRKGDQTAWTVFDIHVLLPKAFQLNHYRFKPGSYELEFFDGCQTVRLFRWAPASAFLSQTNLAQFAADTLDLVQENLLTTSNLGHPAVEWHTNANKRWHTWLFRFKRKPDSHWVRVWHVAGKNRILGIRMDSKKPIDPGLMTAICSNYAIGDIEKNRAK